MEAHSEYTEEDLKMMGPEDPVQLPLTVPHIDGLEVDPGPPIDHTPPEGGWEPNGTPDDDGVDYTDI